MITRLDFAPQAVQVLIHVSTPIDGAVVIMTLDGDYTLFELDSNGSVSAGRILVPIGGSAAACATNLASAITTRWGDRVRAVAENNFVDVIAHHPGVSILTEGVGGGITSRVVHEAQRALPTVIVMVKRDVFAEDVTRGKIVVRVRLDYIELVQVKFLGVNTWNYNVQWTGAAYTYPGRIELYNFGSVPYVAGNWFQLLAIGDRYEQ